MPILIEEFTTSERVALSNAIEEFFSKYSRSVGRPRCNHKIDEKIFNYVKLSPASTIEGNKNNVVNLTTFSGRIKDNVSRYFGISRNTLRKEKEIVNAAEQNPEAFEELRKKVDLRKISIDKAFHQIQKQTKRAEILAHQLEVSQIILQTLLCCTEIFDSYQKQLRMSR